MFMETQRLLYEGPFLAERGVSVARMIAGHEYALHPATRTILELAFASGRRRTRFGPFTGLLS